MKKLKKDTTTIITTEESAKKFKGGRIGIIRPGDKINFNDMKIVGIEAYNINKYFHPKGSGVGFIIELEGKRIYHSGDTDLIPEMKNLGEIDIALLPVGGKYTMNAEEAAEAVKIIKPKIVIPMHYGSVVGSKKDAEKFRERVGKAKMRVVMDGEIVTI